MKRRHVASTTFTSLGYDPDRALLEAEFRDGDVYDYYAVPLKVWRQFEDAPSKGQFFADHIRDRYTYERIERGA